MKNIISKTSITTTLIFPVIMTAFLFAPVFAEISTTVSPKLTDTTTRIERTGTSPVGATKTPLVERTQALTSDAREENLRTRGVNEITRRITSLNELITKIGQLKRLTSTQKSTFITQINAEISSLTDLKTKISADTDLTTLKADVKSVVDSYRVYAVYEPVIRILVAVDAISSTAEKMTMLADKLNTTILEAQTKGKDVTSLTTLYSDMLAKIADAKTQIASAESLVLTLTPAGYPGNKSTLESARTKIKTATQDLKTARSDAQQIYNGLKAFGVTESVKPSLTASPVVTVNQ